MGQQQPPDATPTPTVREQAWTVRHGDCVQVMRELPEASVDAVVCDPPYGIDFQGVAWDGRAIRVAASGRDQRKLTANEAFQVWASIWATECHRVLKPGAHLAAFGAPRTAHRLASALEDAGLQLRDTLMWLYGQGMPKSRRLPHGQGTALKPAYEPIILARKPPAGTIKDNHQAYGTGTLNIEACAPRSESKSATEVRWPANVLLDHHDACRDGACVPECPVWVVDHAADRGRTGRRLAPVSRLFYCPKANRTEREAGCQQLPRRRLDLFPQAQAAPPPDAANCHPTVKPLAVMRWLVRLITPPGGRVLDPFCGSGSTGAAAILESRRFYGIELNADYHAIANARITHWANQPRSSSERDATDAEPAWRIEQSGDDQPACPSALLTRSASQIPGPPAVVALTADAVDAVARRVAELLHVAQPDSLPDRLLTAAQVAEWWGVDRGWVYQHAQALGAQRLGTGTRPRLRFDPHQVARRLNRPEESRPPGTPGGKRRRSRVTARNPARLLEIRGQPELSSTDTNDRPGDTPTPLAAAPKTNTSAR